MTVKTTKNASVEAIMADVRRQVMDGADADRDYAREMRKEAFDASIAKKIAASEFDHAAAVNEYEIANVEGMAGLVPLGMAQGPVWFVTAGKERRQSYASDLPGGDAWARPALDATEAFIGGAGDFAMGGDNTFSQTVEHADRGAKMENEAGARDANIDAEVLGDQAARAKELLQDAREARKQALADAKAVNDERREALRLANQI